MHWHKPWLTVDLPITCIFINYPKVPINSKQTYWLHVKKSFANTNKVICHRSSDILTKAHCYSLIRCNWSEKKEKKHNTSPKSLTDLHLSLSLPLSQFFLRYEMASRKINCIRNLRCKKQTNGRVTASGPRGREQERQRERRRDSQSVSELGSDRFGWGGARPGAASPRARMTNGKSCGGAAMTWTVAFTYYSGFIVDILRCCERGGRTDVVARCLDELRRRALLDAGPNYCRVRSRFWFDRPTVRIFFSTEMVVANNNGRHGCWY